MPELPEVDRVARAVGQRACGAQVSWARLFRSDFCQSYANGREVKTTARSLLMDATIASVARKGKQFALIATDGRVLCFHLGMSGQVLHAESRQELERYTHVHAAWHLQTSGEESGVLFFRDPRRFGGLWSFESRRELERRRWAELGPDALSATGEHLGRALANSRRAIKAALLDQAVLAGVGNIYADEALFGAGIHPTLSCHRMVPDQFERLAGEVRAILGRAVAAGGSTLRDFIAPDGAAGSYQHNHKVYGRKGQPCTRCGEVLRGIQLAQRSTVFCPNCQAKGAGVPGVAARGGLETAGQLSTVRAKGKPRRSGGAILSGASGIPSEREKEISISPLRRRLGR